MANASFGTEDFTIESSKTILLERYTDRINNFSVKVGLEAVSVDEDVNMQWVVLSGTKENRNRAKEYILAICNPEQIIRVKCNSQPGPSDAFLHDVELASGAFLRRKGQLFEIYGSQLTCTLAISKLEQTYNLTIVYNTDGQGQNTDSTSDQTYPPEEKIRPKLNSSQTGILDGVRCLAVDGRTKRNTVAQHASTSNFQRKTVPLSDHKSFTNLSSSHKILPEKTDCYTDSDRPTVNTSVNKCGPVPISHDSSMSSQGIARPVKSSQEGIGSKGFHQSPSSTSTAGAEQLQLELTSLAKGLGFTDSEVEENLDLFDFSKQNVTPIEFLDSLNIVRSKKNKDKNVSSGSMSEHNISGKSQQKSGKKKQKSKNRTGGATAKPSTSSILVVTKTSAFNETDVLQNKPGSSSTDDEIVTRPIDSTNSMNDSIIFMGEENVNDVSLLDAFPMPPASVAQSFNVTNSYQATFASQSSTRHKQKEYSDDEDQTYVLKPYSNSSYESIHARYDPLMMTSDTGAAGPVDSGATGKMESHHRNPEKVPTPRDDLRYIVVDGSNVAMSHGNDKIYSCKGIKICVDYFVHRGHRVKVWVPRTQTYKKQPGWKPPITNQEILYELKDQGYLRFTPARTYNNRHIVCHDDLFILELAKIEDAVIVSNDNFREFVKDYPFIIENRILSYEFSDDRFMLPRDPLGRYGPTLDQFLKKKHNASLVDRQL